MGMALLGLSGWFITATALAGLQAATALRFDVFMPSAGIRLLALGRTGSRYAERLVTHDATFGVLAALRERLFRGWARPDAARRLLARPARLLFRLTADIDALESFYLRLLVPAIAALGAALFAGVVLGFMNAWIGVALALWLVMAGWGIALAVAVRGRPASLRRAHAMEALRARAADLVSGQTELVMAGRSEAQCEALAAADRHLANADHALNRLEVRAGMAYGMAGTLTLVAVLLAAAALVGDGAIGAPRRHWRCWWRSPRSNPSPPCAAARSRPAAPGWRRGAWRPPRAGPARRGGRDSVAGRTLRRRPGALPRAGRGGPPRQPGAGAA